MRLTYFLALMCAVLERGHAIAESDQVALTSDIVPVSRILQPSAQSVEDSSGGKSLRSRKSPEGEATALLAADEERGPKPTQSLASVVESVENMVKKISSKTSQVMPVQIKLDQPKLSQSKLDLLKPPQPVPGQVEPRVPPHKMLKRTSTMQQSERVAVSVAYAQEKARSSGLRKSGRVLDLTALDKEEAGLQTLKRPREDHI